MHQHAHRVVQGGGSFGEDELISIRLGLLRHVISLIGFSQMSLLLMLT
jgi:hypothetical protein